MSTAAKRYAKALFDYSRETGRIDDIRGDFRDLLHLYLSSPEFAALIDDPTIPEETRAEALEGLLQGKADPETLRFLQFLDSKDRLDVLDGICRRFAELYNEHQGILPVEIVSAAPLGDDQLEQMKTRLQARYGKTIEATVSLDPSMIGGFRIRVGDTIHDYSIATQLDHLQQQLLTAQ